MSSTSVAPWKNRQPLKLPGHYPARWTRRSSPAGLLCPTQLTRMLQTSILRREVARFLPRLKPPWRRLFLRYPSTTQVLCFSSSIFDCPRPPHPQGLSFADYNLHCCCKREG